MARGQALRLSRAHLRKNGCSGMGMKWTLVPTPRARSSVDEFIAADVELVQVQAEGVEMPGMAAVVARGRHLHFLESGQAALVDAGVSRAQGMQALDFFELAQADGGLHVAEVVLEAGLEHLVIPAPLFGVAIPGVLGDAVQAEHAHALGQGGVVGGDHAAFAGGDVLGGVEAEGRGGAGRAGGSGREAAILSVGGVSGVFDDVEMRGVAAICQISSMRQGSPARCTGMMARVRQVTRAATQAGSRLPSGPTSASTGVAPTCRMTLTVAQKVSGSRDDFVALADAGRGQGQVQAGGAGVHRQRVAGAGVLPEMRFETRRALAGGQPAGAQSIRHLGDFFLADGRHVKRYEGSLFHDSGRGSGFTIKNENLPPVSSVSPVPDRSRRAGNCSGRSTGAA